jgi:hypothetical protein
LFPPVFGASLFLQVARNRKAKGSGSLRNCIRQSLVAGG